jgi:hypothetical protein
MVTQSICWAYWEEAVIHKWDWCIASWSAALPFITMMPMIVKVRHIGTHTKYDDMGYTLDAYHPAEVYTDNTLHMRILFTTLNECCLKSPDSCLVPTVNITKMKRDVSQEMFISKYKIKTLHYTSRNEYPAYMPPWEGWHVSLWLQGGILLCHSV